MNILATKQFQAHEKLNRIKYLYNEDPDEEEEKLSNIYWADQSLMDIVNAELAKQHAKERQELFSSLKKNLYDRVGLMENESCVDSLLKGTVKKALKKQHFSERRKLFNQYQKNLLR